MTKSFQYLGLSDTAIIKWLLIVVGVFVFENSFCQENFLPGYVITSTKDSISGDIDYQEWLANPDQISFRKAAADKIVTYTLRDIILFAVKNEKYISAIVETEISANRTEEMDYDPTLKFKTDTVFLQTLYEGGKKLFYYMSKTGHENFYIHDKDSFFLLIHKKYLKEEGSKKLLMQNNKYKGQLTLYLNECKTIQSKLLNTEYNMTSMIDLFKYYYACVKSDYLTFEKKKDKAAIEFGISGGISISSIDFENKYMIDLPNTDFPTSANVCGGFYINFDLPRNLKKFSICNDLIYTSYKVEGTYVDRSSLYYLPLPYEIVYTSELGYAYLKLINMFRYKYAFENFSLFMKFGVTNAVAINETNHKTVYFNSKLIQETKSIEDARKYEQGYCVGAGIALGKIAAEARMEKSNGMSPYSDLGSYVTRIYYLLSYKF